MGTLAKPNLLEICEAINDPRQRNMVGVRLAAALARGADPLARDDMGRDALMVMASRGHLPSLKVLMPVSDALAQDDEGQSALMKSAKTGNDACMRLLMAVSDVNAQDKSGLSVLHFMMHSARIEILAELLILIDPLKRDGNGLLPSESLLASKDPELRFAVEQMQVRQSQAECGALEKELSPGARRRMSARAGL